MSRPDRLILGTRGSALALAQSGLVARALSERHDGLVVEQHVIRTEGDLRATDRFGPGDRGVFVKAIEQALAAGKIDFAVHSLKDLPSEDSDGLALAAIPEREDPRDALVTPDGLTFDELPEGSIVGTGSPRRRSQLLHTRPDLELQGLRGNIDTRVSRVDGAMDAVVLAAAGLNRLRVERPWTPIDPGICLPAVGQGALALQARDGDSGTIDLLAALDDEATRQQVAAERAFLAELGGGCMAPATAWARHGDDGLIVEAMVAEIDGGGRAIERCACPAEEGPARARELARRLIESGAARWIEAAREDPAGDG